MLKFCTELVPTPLGDHRNVHSLTILPNLYLFIDLLSYTNWQLNLTKYGWIACLNTECGQIPVDHDRQWLCLACMPRINVFDKFTLSHCSVTIRSIRSHWKRLIGWQDSLILLS